MTNQTECDESKQCQTGSCPICTGIGWLFRNPYTTFVLRLFLGALLIYASIYKIQFPPHFARGVLNYEFFPFWLVNFIAITIPWVELIVGVFLVVGLFTRASNLIALGMFCVFFVLISWVLYWGLEIDCGCFSKALEGHLIDGSYLFRDGLFVLFSIQILFAKKIILSLDRLRHVG